MISHSYKNVVKTSVKILSGNDIWIFWKIYWHLLSNSATKFKFNIFQSLGSCDNINKFPLLRKDLDKFPLLCDYIYRDFEVILTKFLMNSLYFVMTLTNSWGFMTNLRDEFPGLCDVHDSTNNTRGF